MPMRAPTQQFSFSGGMVDEMMEARADIRSYYSSAIDTTNMMGLPLGGLDMRKGMAMVAELPEAAAGFKLAPFQFSNEQKYLTVFTNSEFRVYKDGVLQTTIASPWTAAQLANMDYTQSLDTMICVHPDVQYHKVMRTGAHDSWAINVLAVTNIPQYNYGSGDENVWSIARGWPQSVYLREGRLHFGGSKSRPQTSWASSSEDYFSFFVDSADLDTNSVESTLDNDRVSSIEQLYALDDMFALTSGGLFVQDQSPVTPNNYFFKRHSEVPACNIRPVELDGSVMFLTDEYTDEDGVLHHQTLMEIVPAGTADTGRNLYSVQDVGLLVSSLIRNPKGMAAQLGGVGNSAHRLFIVNGDGTVAVLQTRKSQKITGWTLLNTDGFVLDVAVVGKTVYFMVKRTINGVVRYFIERLRDDALLDCSITLSDTTAKTIWDGLDYLEGHRLAVIGDDAYMGDYLVTGGTIEIDYAVRKVEVGLPFNWAAETMPLEIELTNGTLVGERHKITKATVRLIKTTSLTLNGKNVSFSKFGDDLLDKPPQAFTGLKCVRLLGWTGGRDGKGASVRMEGSSTGRATILSLSAEVAQ